MSLTPNNVSEISEKNSVIIIDIEGKLNSETAEALINNVDALIEQGKLSILIDGEFLTFISSGGIGALLSSTNKIRKSGGTLAISSLNSEVESLLKTLRITELLRIYPTKEEAIDSFKSSMFPSEPKQDYTAGQDDEVLHPEPQEETKISVTTQNQEDFSSPIIIECTNCGSLSRVHRPGDYICPTCRTEFHVAEDGSAIF